MIDPKSRNINIKQIMIQIFLIISSFFIGVYFNKMFVVNLIVNIGYGVLPVPIQLLLLFSEILVFYVCLKFLISKTSWMDKYLLLFAYSVLLLIILFGRPSGSHSTFGLNPFSFIFESMNDLRSLATTFLNLLLLVPIQLFSFLFRRNLSFKQGVWLSFCFGVIIEMLQLILSRGIFDVSDIVVYVLGYIIGYFLVTKILNVQKLIKKM